ncbi:MAG: aldehyde dehydrogenase family protein [Lutibacter sp.]
MLIQAINPNTNKTVKSFEEMTEKTVDAKEAKAQLAFTNWKETSYQQRADLFVNKKLIRVSGLNDPF